MKYVYTKGDYATFRGRVFMYRQPVEITDKGTLEAIAKHPDYRRVDEEEKAEAPVLDACPKCGKVVKQGKFLHVKYCKGA